MGMFDTINVKLPCPKCGTMMKDFQSKDNECLLLKLDPSHVDNFYSTCSKCGEWVEFSRLRIPTSLSPREEPFNLTEIEAMGFRLNNE